MESFRCVLELVYFASGPVIVVLAIIGLKQLKTAKSIARKTAKRESLKLAADQCEYYHRHIIPLQNELFDAIASRGVTFFEKAEVTIRSDAVRVKYSPDDDFFDQIMKVVSELTAALNAMEAFAVFFTSGVADESVAFSSLGRSFCNTTQKLLPKIVFYCQTGHFHNLYHLFLMWNSRLEAGELLREKENIEARLKSVDNKFITPVGTK